MIPIRIMPNGRYHVCIFWDCSAKERAAYKHRWMIIIEGDEEEDEGEEEWSGNIWNF